MSAAIDAKSAKERAQIAAAFIRRGGESTRAFDDCLEMGDGDEVVSILCQMAKRSPKLKENIRRYISASSLAKYGL